MRRFTQRSSVPGALLALQLLAGDASAADCVTSAGKTACGFHCVTADGQVRCSQTPEGVCSVASGVVACWDPPPILKKVLQSRLPEATCATTYGQTACGYSCETNSDHALCAQTPFGKCVASEGRVVCWDPPAAVVAIRGARTPLAKCIAESGKIACGYNCVSHDGTLQCAQTPDGTCRIEQGKVVCWDPPLDSLGAVFEPSAELACMDGVEGRSCGYRCVATALHSACGRGRDESCASTPNGIVCRAP